MPARQLLFASDLDGCLLDEQTYSFEAARPALAALAEAGAVLVLASSKTRAEMRPLAAALGLSAPMAVENGGALLLPVGYLPVKPAKAAEEAGWWTIVLGAPRARLARELHEIARQTGAAVRGFGDMSLPDIARLTGLSSEQAALAAEREFDEPFLLLSGDDRSLASAARSRGLRVSAGGRFHHLTGDTDKGRALAALLELLGAARRHYATVGLGDSPNDLPLLQTVGRPIVVPRPGGRPHPELARALPGAELAAEPGPAGWSRAVLAVLTGNPLRRVVQPGAS